MRDLAAGGWRGDRPTCRDSPTLGRIFGLTSPSLDVSGRILHLHQSPMVPTLCAGWCRYPGSGRPQLVTENAGKREEKKRSCRFAIASHSIRGCTDVGQTRGVWELGPHPEAEDAGTQTMLVSRGCPESITASLPCQRMLIPGECWYPGDAGTWSMLVPRGCWCLGDAGIQTMLVSRRCPETIMASLLGQGMLVPGGC